MRRRRPIMTFAALAVSLAATATVVAFPLPAAAGGGPQTYPGCAPTLQQCIDGNPGETIFIETETVAEDIKITTSNALAAVAGFTPTIDSIDITRSTGAINVLLRGLTIDEGIWATFTGGTGHVLTIQRVTVNGIFPNTGSGIMFDTVVPATFTLERSRIRSVTNGFYGLWVDTRLPSGATTVRVIGNRFSEPGNNGGPGIFVRHSIAGVHRTDIMNNTIWDAMECLCGSPASLVLIGQGIASIDANVVGNTIERSEGYGIGVRNLLESEGSFTLDVFDNIIAHADLAGIDLSDEGGSPIVWRAGYNDLFANGPNDLGGRPLGPGTMFVNPRFVDRANGNLKLRSTSPLIDAGQVCTPGGVANPDAAGKHRLRGSSVDIGAYELGAAPPTGQMIVGGPTADLLSGTNGADLICGYAGADEISGLGGPDYLDGGAHGDLIFGGGGRDALYGRGGPDRLCAADGTRGNDRVDGGNGFDRYSADAGDTLISVEQQGANCI